MNTTAIRSRVVKFGGSMFDLPFWMLDVERWIAGQPVATTLVVVGGGEAIDDVAAEQWRSGMSDADAHWQCIRVMGDYARSLTRLLPEWRLVSDPRELDAAAAGSTFVIEADVFMRGPDAALGGGALPESWDVSSDSIAARAAELFAADELVLLKSTLPDDLDKLGDYVDRYFAEAAKQVPAIRFVYFRNPAFPEVRWR
jgi:5-(aminomethyl)-3-furanmethanol phosphate kinase